MATWSDNIAKILYTDDGYSKEMNCDCGSCVTVGGPKDYVKYMYFGDDGPKFEREPRTNNAEVLEGFKSGIDDLREMLECD